jgi:uncharacterized membrane protein
MKRRTPHMHGQVGVIMTLVLATLIGAVGLCTDVGVLYFNWVQLQKAADSAALAGAIHLTGIPATTDNSKVVATADQYAQLNGIKSAEIVSTTVAGDPKSVTIQLQRTVPYLFARVLGLTNGSGRGPRDGWHQQRIVVPRVAADRASLYQGAVG